jgi:hypothetical protein
MVNVFTIQDEKIVLSPNLFIVPEFKNILDNRKEDALLIFKFLYCLYHYDSPYADVPESDKTEMIITDLKLDISLDDVLIEAAKKKAELLYFTPTRRFYNDAKIGMEKMGAYLRDQSLVSGRDGNLSAVITALKSAGAITAQFRILEKEYKDEISAGVRGGHDMSYDEG